MSWLDDWKESACLANEAELPTLTEKIGIEAVIGQAIELGDDGLATVAAEALRLQGQIRPLQKKLDECKEVIRRCSNGRPWSIDCDAGRVKVGPTTPDTIVREVRFNQDRFLELDESVRRILVEAGLVHVTHTFVPDRAEEADESLREVVRSVLDVVASVNKGRKGTVTIAPCR